MSTHSTGNIPHTPHFPTDYDEYASTYRWARFAVPWVLEPLQRAVDSSPRDGTILELGCGTANYIIALSESNESRRLIGMDISKPMIEQAHGRESRVRFMVGDAARAIPIRDAVLSVVFAVDVVHHIVDIERFFSEAARTLRRDGVIVIVTDSAETLRDRSLTHFFPEILEIELQRYPTLDHLVHVAEHAGLRLDDSSRADGYIEIDDDWIQKIEAKCSSGMRQLSPSQHEAGVARVREARTRGEKWRSCYNTLWFSR
ncbi:MAG TPA: class I SAM-dependent methyltransferase [Gemmatimonadaceae bacterium]|nr:class I SAM-dependent methyltransferase [Gemmatimonadaceae bacterium]